VTCEVDDLERRERLAFIRSLREKTQKWTKQDRYACFAQENKERRVEMEDKEDMEDIDIEQVKQDTRMALYIEGYCDGLCSEHDRDLVVAFWKELESAVNDEFWVRIKRRVRGDEETCGTS